MDDATINQVETLRQQMAERRSNALSQLGGGKKGISQLLGGDSSGLAEAASKRSSDRLKFSTFMLKQKMIDDLDATLERGFNKNPELRGNVFIGFVTGERFHAEVVDLKTAAKATTDVSEEEALLKLSEQPVGYFSPNDFTMKTPDNPAHQELKNELDEYFRRNRPIMNYLREHPDAGEAPTINQPRS